MNADYRTLPPCLRHFHTGHRWWCRSCDRETARQVRDLLAASDGSVAP